MPTKLRSIIEISTRLTRAGFWTLVVVVPWMLTAPVHAGVDELGRNDVRIYSAPFEVRAGHSVIDIQLADRLEQLGFARVRQRPTEPGQFFWGYEVFWIFPEQEAIQASESPLVGLRLRRKDGEILGRQDESPAARGEVVFQVPAQLLAEDFTGRRAARIGLQFSRLPEHVWQPLLAAEDARFFEHQGIDGRGVARALLANVRAGKVKQGGSTITQQLIKMRDLAPKRSLGRKVSEAVRALSLEAEYDKQDILEEYLNHVYLGHVQGISLYGYGAAARAFFAKQAHQLTLGEAALLAAIVQAPNRYSPVRNREAVVARYRWILDRLEELGWISGRELQRARARVPSLEVRSPKRAISPAVLSHLEESAARLAPGRAEQGRGFIIETTLDPWLQRVAEKTVDQHLKRIRARVSGREQVQAALLAIRASTGEVVAYVGGGSGGGGLDRVTNAKRQPGSAVKPLVLAHAFADCGSRDPLYPSRSVSNGSWKLDLPSGEWRPQNPDDSLGGTVTLREATSRSLNLPFVRLGAWCGWDAVAGTFRDAGISLPNPVPPAFTLGAIEVSPWNLATAYTALASDGRKAAPRLWTEIRRPAGRLVGSKSPDRNRVIPETVSFLVRDVLRQAVREGSARAAAVGSAPVFAKTGTSSDRRDAWTAGGIGDLVVVVWVGRDDGARLGLSGGAAAAPLFGEFVAAAIGTQVRTTDSVPHGIEQQAYDAKTGLLVGPSHRRAEVDWFWTRHQPARRRWWRSANSIPTIQ